MNNIHTTDIAIIGAGPVGVFAAFQAGMLEIKCHIIDSLDQIGGQCQALYPEKPIYDIPGYKIIAAQDLITNLYEQASPFKPTYHLGQQVVKLEKENDYFFLTTSKLQTISCKAVIIAAGGGAFGPNKPPIEDIETYENKSVFFHIDDKHRFRDKFVAIAGGGDSAIDWAIELSDIAAKIYLIHRREKFSAHPANVSKVQEIAKSGKIELVIPYQLANLNGRDGYLSNIVVKTIDNQFKTLNANYLLSFFGLATNLGPINDWSLNLEHRHIIVEQASCATNIAGIYAIGDIATYPKKLKLILTGFAEAASAVHDLYKLVKDKHLHFSYSTTKGINVSQ